MAEQLVAACLPTSMCGSPVKGSTIEACDTCGAAVWVAPSSRAHSTTFICLLCIPKDADICAPFPDQIEEVRREMAK